MMMMTGSSRLIPAFRQTWMTMAMKMTIPGKDEGQQAAQSTAQSSFHIGGRSGVAQAWKSAQSTAQSLHNHAFSGVRTVSVVTHGCTINCTIKPYIERGWKGGLW